MKNYSAQVTQRLSPLMMEIIEHPLYTAITTIDDLQLFMGHHVFAVWDFMCLLKELHRNIVSTSSPWFPPRDAMSAHLINSILVEEEGDLLEDGVTYSCHYEMYLSAMEQIGANTQPIKQLLFLLKNGHDLSDALTRVGTPPSAKNFVMTTFSFFDAKTHELAAAFVFGRESVTSPMFSPFLKTLEDQLNENMQTSRLMHYLKRHIELDSTEHFPKALKMLENMAGEDEQKWQEIENAAIKALKARIDFLSGIQHSLPHFQNVACATRS